MRKTNIVGLLVIVALWASVHVYSQNWQIVPGSNVGPITKDTSEKELIKMFGGTNVKLSPIDVGEGETQLGTVLFPGNPQKRAYILWRDPGTRLQPESISVKDKNTIWKSDKGITIGTSLRALEALNGGAFALTGFAWDYEGTVVHSNGGKLTELGVGAGEDILGRTLLLRLAPAPRTRNIPEYKKVLGDNIFLSNDPAMKKINPVVYEMVAEFPDQVAQGANPTEDKLIATLHDLRSYSAYGGPGYDEEKLAAAQQEFEKLLLKNTKSQSTLSYGFDKLNELMSIATSLDGKLRIYSWDLEDG